MRRGLVAALLGFGVVMMAAEAGAQSRRPVPLSDPARNLVRVEVRFTTDARFGSVRAVGSLGNNLAQAQGQRIAGPADLRAAVLDNLLAVSGNVEGQTASASFRLVLTQIDAGGSVSWQVNVQPGHRATIDIYNLNKEQQPRLVDHFDGAAGDTFTTSADQLRVDGPLARPADPASRLVLGHYYPWYDRTTWADPQMLDQPQRIYSTDDPADVLADLTAAQKAGLDGVIVSWQDGDWNASRMALVVQAAQQLGMKVSVQIETRAANPNHHEGDPPDADVLVLWVQHVLDAYGASPAFLRANGRPVIFFYAWTDTTDDTWRAVVDRIRASGRAIFVMADTFDPASLAIADGEYTYGINIFATDIDTFSRTLALSARTWHLLGADRGAQRLAAATVTPGYDDHKLTTRTRPLFVDRQSGTFFDKQWQAALASGADWILVTTWNEWWENTEVEPSQRYGNYYSWMTKTLGTLFKKSPRQAP